MIKRKRLVLPYSDQKEADWDNLWITYYKREPQQLASQKEMTIESLPADRDGLIEDVTLFISCEPSAIAGRNVMEVGCGSGYLAKRIAKHASLFLGIDWSGLALLVARRTCPENTLWAHPRDLKVFREHAGTIDTVLARNFMIHQNFERTQALLLFESEMLRPGGKIYADFWFDNPEIHNGHGVWPATTTDIVPPNAVYRFTETEIKELANGAELNVADSYLRPDLLRNFVTFEKPTPSARR